MFKNKNRKKRENRKRELLAGFLFSSFLNSVGQISFKPTVFYITFKLSILTEHLVEGGPLSPALKAHVSHKTLPSQVSYFSQTQTMVRPSRLSNFPHDHYHNQCSPKTTPQRIVVIATFFLELLVKDYYLFAIKINTLNKAQVSGIIISR